MPLIEENIRVSKEQKGVKNTFGKESPSRTMAKYNKEFYLNSYKHRNKTSDVKKKIKKKKWVGKIKKLKKKRKKKVK